MNPPTNCEVQPIFQIENACDTNAEGEQLRLYSVIDLPCIANIYIYKQLYSRDILLLYDCFDLETGHCINLMCQLSSTTRDILF